MIPFQRLNKNTFLFQGEISKQGIDSPVIFPKGTNSILFQDDWRTRYATTTVSFKEFSFLDIDDVSNIVLVFPNLFRFKDEISDNNSYLNLVSGCSSHSYRERLTSIYKIASPLFAELGIKWHYVNTRTEWCGDGSIPLIKSLYGLNDFIVVAMGVFTIPMNIYVEKAGLKILSHFDIRIPQDLCISLFQQKAIERLIRKFTKVKDSIQLAALLLEIKTHLKYNRNLYRYVHSLDKYYLDTDYIKQLKQKWADSIDIEKDIPFNKDGYPFALEYIEQGLPCYLNKYQISMEEARQLLFTEGRGHSRIFYNYHYEETKGLIFKKVV